MKRPPHSTNLKRSLMRETSVMVEPASTHLCCSTFERRNPFSHPSTRSSSNSSSKYVTTLSTLCLVFVIIAVQALPGVSLTTHVATSSLTRERHHFYVPNTDSDPLEKHRKRARRGHSEQKSSRHTRKGKHSKYHKDLAPAHVDDVAGDDARVGDGWSADVVKRYDNEVAAGAAMHADPPGVWEEDLPAEERRNDTNVTSASWQRLPTPEEMARFKLLVQHTMRCRKLPALTLALVKNGRVLLTATLGYADPERHVGVKRDTRFAIGSLTKAFTATLVVSQLLKLNKSLDTPIEYLMPEMKLMDEERTRSVTVRDLLGHRVGVPGYFNALLVGFPAHVTRKQLLSRLRYLPAAVPLRSKFMYNNYLYTLAAHVLEVQTGRSWESLVRAHILRPLAMTHTGFVDEVQDYSRFALPCALLNGTVKNLSPDLLKSVSPCGPGGSLFSTAHDMARWMQALLSNGTGPDGHRVLDARALEETTRAAMPPPGLASDLTMPEFPVSDVEQYYALGWVTSNYRGYRKVWHSGGIVTYSSRLWLLPGVDAGLFVATSGPQTADKGHALTALTSAAADLLLGLPFWLNESTACTFPAPWKPATAPFPTPSSSSSSSSDNSSFSTSSASFSFSSSSSNYNSAHSGVKRNSAGEISNGLREADAERFIGVYEHDAFGQIVIEKAEIGKINKDKDVTMHQNGSDEIFDIDLGRKPKSFQQPSVGNNTVSPSHPTSSPSLPEVLLLRYGRFGLMELTGPERRAADASEGVLLEGRFVGPLWFVTASDELDTPVRVRFLYDDRGFVDRILYPIDGQSDDVEFRRDLSSHGDIVASSSTFSTAAGSMTSIGLGWVLVLNCIWVWVGTIAL